MSPVDFGDCGPALPPKSHLTARLFLLESHSGLEVLLSPASQDSGREQDFQSWPLSACVIPPDPAGWSAAATFQRNRLGIEVLDQKDLDVVIRAVEAMIDGVNFDVAFRQ